MDRLISVDFNSSIENLMVDAIARDVEKAILAGDFSEKTDESLPWMPFSVLVVVNNRQQRFKGSFRVKNEMGDWFAEMRFNPKGFSGKKFMEVVNDNGDVIAQSILTFCTSGMRSENNNSEET